MTIKQVQHISFTGPEGLRRVREGGFNKSNSMNPGVQNGNQEELEKATNVSPNPNRTQLMEAQKSKDTLSCSANDTYTKGIEHSQNGKLHSEAHNNTTGVQLQVKSSNNLNNSNQKTAKTNFRGLSNSAANSIKDSFAWKFSKNKYVQWFIKKAANNQSVFEAINALVITCGLRPAAIMAQTNKDNKEKNKKAASHSISSGVIGYVFAVALFSPIAAGLKKLKNNPAEFAKKSGAFLQKNGEKVVSMAASKRAQTFTSICTYGPQLFTAAVRSAITIAMIPVIDRYILNPIFGKPKSTQPEERPTMDPRYNYTYINFSSSPKAKKAFQSFSGDFK